MSNAREIGHTPPDKSALPKSHNTTLDNTTMADQNPAETKPATELPERPKEGTEGEEKGPSKAALKKAAKEKEKVIHGRS